ncbi:polyadenylate-binding protein RBP47B' isoform X2 [Vigna radiata var. radiata]|uniref:Polyadenylate-binding protein RBP47B' isoform X2 n=1 Tax=Vigna radiata var. radiata TaxID=3916 RepID=A0A3Q0EYX9_VIGRR|nr:polyadenylate-binding protein RBP47B' isoform X2 [Vigna radiata var. radiata]
MAAAASQGYSQPSTIEEVRTLWIGDLQYWVDETYLAHCFAHTGEVLSIKIIRNKMTGQPEGYGFVEFVSHEAAERVLQTYNGTFMPGTEQTFRLNWASFGIGERRPDAGPEHSVFVGDLAPDVTDYLLQETFRAHYHSVRGAKVITDPNTGRSKGYGFVKFSDENERNRSMSEMNGVYCSTRAMRISAATPKKSTSGHAAPSKPVNQTPAYTAPVQVQPPEYDVNNTTIFVGNLDPNVSEEELKQNFLEFGEIISVKIPLGRGCGFVQFRTRASAEEVIQNTQGKIIGQQVVRISWGRTLAARQMDPSQWNAYYGYGQGYEAYGYGAAQDPSSYTYGAYGAYGGYQQYPSQQVEGAQDPTGMPAPTMDPREELYDPSAMQDVDKLNEAYSRVHGNAILGRSLWQTSSSSSLPKT